METATRVQTAFRLPVDLLARAKRRAAENHQSLNRYLEQLIERDTRLVFPHIPKDYKISEEIRNLACIKTDPKYLSKDPQEQIRLDKQAKLEYLMEKFGLK